LTVTDDGRGFDLAAIAPRSGHGAGLPGMRERASLVGGEISITSEPGSGTTVKLRMPLRTQTGTLRS
jgi:two-component system sensor histidine kinase NreB